MLAAMVNSTARRISCLSVGLVASRRTSQSRLTGRYSELVVKEKQSADVDAVLGSQRKPAVVFKAWLGADEIMCAPSRVSRHVQNFIMSWDFFAVHEFWLLGKRPF